MTKNRRVEPPAVFDDDLRLVPPSETTLSANVAPDETGGREMDDPILALAYIQRAIELCDKAGLVLPACHLQLGLDMISRALPALKPSASPDATER